LKIDFRVMAIKINSSEQVKLLSAFLDQIRDDPRISPAHISLYTALISYWHEKKFEHPMSVFSREIMPLCKISGRATYVRSIRELHDYGYIHYIASYNHFLGSLVYFREAGTAHKMTRE